MRRTALCTAFASALVPASCTGSASNSDRLGSFLVVGDWGWNPACSGNIHSQDCQKTIATKMDMVMDELGDVKFIINVGDSFYPNGVTGKDDPRWDSAWRTVYSARLRSVPWYSVYGNHDYLLDECSCQLDAQACHQVNANTGDRGFFYMPSTQYFVELPELETEVVALDTNHLDRENINPYSKCKDATLESVLQKRLDDSFALITERLAKSTAKNLLVFSHYPTDYFNHTYPAFLDQLRGARQHLTYFGGHRHAVDQFSTVSIAPQNTWLVGGGGGWSWEDYNPDANGFVVGSIALDGTLTTSAVLIGGCPALVGNATGSNVFGLGKEQEGQTLVVL